MAEQEPIYLEKALQSLEGAVTEYVNNRFDNCASRCYYSAFQAAIYALEAAGIQPRNDQGEWPHTFVQSQFVGQLINRRKRYPATLREVLIRNLELRQVADYRPQHVSQAQVARALQRAEAFLDAIQQGGERQ